MSKVPFNETFKQQQRKLVRATFKKAFISNINVSANTVDVYFAESPNTIIRNIPLASTLKTTFLAIGDRCRVDVFDETNPNDMVVAYTYGRIIKSPTFNSGFFIKNVSSGGTDIIPHGIIDGNGNGLVPDIYGIIPGDNNIALSHGMYISAADTVNLNVSVTSTAVSYNVFWFAIKF